MKILTCNSNRPLAEAISVHLGLPLTQASVRRFSDMEVFVEIHENVRGEDVFVMYVHVEPGVLIVEQKNTVEQGGGKGMAVTERVREPGLASQNFTQIFCRCSV